MVYAAISFFAFAFVVMRLHFFACGIARAAGNIFEQLLNSILRAPLLFHETTPLGRITNRISSDQAIIDESLFRVVNGVVASSSWLLGGMAIMIATLPYMAILLVVVLLLYFTLYRYYRKSCVEVQRLTAVTRSPIQSHFQEVLHGLTSVRAFDVIDLVCEKTSCLVDEHSRTLVSLQIANRWLAVRLEALGAVVLLGASMMSWIFRLSITPGMAGLVVMWAAQFSLSLNFNTINLTECESLLTSVERALEYIKLKGEEEEVATKYHLGASVDPPINWPRGGNLKFEDVQMRYREKTPLALAGLSFDVSSGQRVGIVGRTGAGKSSIATALYRLRELEGGQIFIDDVDIAKIPINFVRGGRAGMAMITQDPLIFSGPVRRTLDPFYRYKDSELWHVLAEVHMDDTIRRAWAAENVDESYDPNDALQLQISESGGNLSVGQRQLICFARALLQKPKILILDEATASVDYETDRKIQEMLREKFPGTTLLVIAHRLQTVIDLDLILGLSEGKAVEFGPPHQLLSSPDSLLSHLVDSTGTESASMLRSMASNAVNKSVASELLDTRSE